MIIKNPIVTPFCADPEARKYGGRYYIYVTYSASAEKGLSKGNITAFSSEDLLNWEIHPDIIAMEDFPEVEDCVWAPTIIDKNGRYYLIFACNDIKSDDEVGGLVIAVSDTPVGPFRRFTEGLLVDKFVNGAQPIDAHLFKDDDGTVWLYYGGWSHCNVCRMKSDMSGLDTLEDGTDEIFREVTPEDYVEAPCMIKDNGLYYFMWSAGCWMDGTYRVNYAVVDSPISGFNGATPILSTQLPIADGPGHHGFLHIPEKDTYLIVYHRRIPGVSKPSARVLCIDKMNIHDGKIEPVIMTNGFEL